MNERGRLRLLDYVTTNTAVKQLAEDEWFSADGGDLPQPVTLRLRTMPDGRRVCTGLLIGALTEQEIPARDLRRISLPDILALMGDEERGRTKDKGWKAYVDRPRAAPLADAAASYRPSQRPAAGWPDEHFVQVARAYRVNLASHPFSPMKALARQLGVSEPTARRWVLVARYKGLLGKSVPGKAGTGPLAIGDEAFALQLEEVWVGAGKSHESPPVKKSKRSSDVRGTRRKR